MIGKTNTGGSGGKIDIGNDNTTTSSYYSADGTISSGTFVEFVGDEVAYTTNSVRLMSIKITSQAYGAAKMGDGILFAYNDTDNYINVKYFKVNKNGEVYNSIELKTTISNFKFNDVNDIKVVAMSDTIACIIYSHKTDKVGVVAVKVANNSISIGTPVSNNTISYQSSMHGGIKLTDNKLLLLHTYGTYYYIYASIIEVNDTTLTFKSTTKASTTSNLGYDYIKIINLSSNYYLITCGDNNNYLKGTVISVDITNNTITSKINYVTLASYTNSCRRYGIVKLENNKALVCYGNGDNLEYKVISYSISDNKITQGTSLVLSDNSYVYMGSDIYKMGLQNKVIGLVAGYYAYELDLSEITVSGTQVTLTKSTTNLTHDNGGSQVNVYNRFIYESPSCSYYIYNIENDSSSNLGLKLIRTTGDKVQPSTKFIDGITTSKVTSTSSGNVITLS